MMTRSLNQWFRQTFPKPSKGQYTIFQRIAKKYTMSKDVESAISQVKNEMPTDADYTIDTEMSHKCVQRVSLRSVKVL